MQLGETISRIRKEKNISIKDLCGEHLSRSAYTRFVNGETDTSANNFLYFLEQLHVTLNEFMFIQNDYSLSDAETYLIKLNSIVLEGNSEGILAIQKECKLLSENEKDKYYHISLLCDIYISRLENKPFKEKVITEIKDYLMNVDTWTHYELGLFNNSMFIFEIEIIEILLNRVLNSIERYKVVRNYTNESFIMLTNILNIYLSSGEIVRATKLFKILANQDLSEDFVKERLLFQFWKGIILLVAQNDLEGHEIVNQVLKTCDFLGSKGYKNALSNMYIFITNLYNCSIDN